MSSTMTMAVIHRLRTVRRRCSRVGGTGAVAGSGFGSVGVGRLMTGSPGW